MDTLQVKYNHKFDYSISSICICILPDFKFKPDRKSMIFNFAKPTIRLIWLTYFSLILNGVIRINYNKIRRKLFGIIPINQIVVVPQLDTDRAVDSKTGWIETQIIASINNCQPSSKQNYGRAISDQAKMMIDNMLGAYEEYKAPEKKIIERIIIYGKDSLWDYSYSSNPLEFKRSISIDLKNNLGLLRREYDKIEQLELEMIESNKDMKNIRSKIIKKIRYEIGRHEIVNPDEHTG
jgi:hypothetical protein